MAFLDEVETLILDSSAAGHQSVGALLTTALESRYLANDGSANGIIATESTDQAYFLAASSDGAGIEETSTDEAYYLTDEAPVWLLYKSHLPDSTAIGRGRAIVVLQTAGGGIMGRVALDQPGLQVIVRGEQMLQVSTAYPEAESKMVDVVDAMHAYAGSSLTDTHWAGVWCEAGPTFEGYDDLMRPYFSADFRIMRQTT